MLDNLREGVITPDIYDPALNPLYRDVLAHYGAVALPCRVRDPDRKGKVESGVGHAQRTPLAGMRFESIEEAQAYLDRWETHWADTRIHGTTKRQVAVMFAEEKPHLRRCRSSRFATTSTASAPCISTAASRSTPPTTARRPAGLAAACTCSGTARACGSSIRRPASCCASTCARSAATTASSTRTARRGRRRRPRRLLRRARGAGQHVGAVCEHIHRHEGEPGVRRILGVLSLAKKHGAPTVDDRGEDRAGPRRAHLPLHAALARAPPAGAADAAPDRSAHPPPLAVPRPHPTQNRRPRMNLVEIDHALRKLRLSGMADVLETRLRHAQTERLAPIDLISTLVSDELLRRQDRLFGRRIKPPRFRDADRSLDSFDFDFNKKMNRALIYELATARFVAQREDVLLLGPPGTGKSHLAQAIGRAAIQQGHRVIYREAHVLIEEIADAGLDGTRKQYIADLAAVPLLIVDDLGMRKLPHTAAEDLLELVMRRYERASTLLTSNRPVDDWGKLLGDTAAVTALLDRLLHHAHVLKCGPRSWRTKVQPDLRHEVAAG